jgi:hypothetical protein
MTMTDYSTMNVHQLMEKAVDIGTQYGHAVWKDGCEEMDALESALRKAVIREDVVHCGECRYGKRPWLGAVTDYCSEGRRKEEP